MPDTPAESLSAHSIPAHPTRSIENSTSEISPTEVIESREVVRIETLKAESLPQRAGMHGIYFWRSPVTQSWHLNVRCQGQLCLADRDEARAPIEAQARELAARMDLHIYEIEAPVESSE